MTASSRLREAPPTASSVDRARPPLAMPLDPQGLKSPRSLEMLQRLAGNRAVGGWIAVQRQPAGSGTNSARKLRQAELEELIVLYLAASPTHTVGSTGATYTGRWVRGRTGTNAIRAAIERKLKWQIENNPDAAKTLQSSSLFVGLRSLWALVQRNAGDAARTRWLTERITFYQHLAASPTAAAFHKKYQIEVRPLPGGGCMTALYQGTSVLFSESEYKDIRAGVVSELKDVRAKARKAGKDKEAIEEAAQNANSVDLILKVMRDQGKAGPKIALAYNRRTKSWNPTLESTVLANVDPAPGWYFFGLSVSGGYHSVTLVVDNARASGARIYWMDQYTRGFTKDVTGRLDRELKDYEPSYGFTETRVWRILPTKETVITLP
jgi:hypothetical protein